MLCGNFRKKVLLGFGVDLKSKFSKERISSWNIGFGIKLKKETKAGL